MLYVGILNLLYSSSLSNYIFLHVNNKPNHIPISQGYLVKIISASSILVFWLYNRLMWSCYSMFGNKWPLTSLRRLYSLIGYSVMRSRVRLKIRYSWWSRKSGLPIANLLFPRFFKFFLFFLCVPQNTYMFCILTCVLTSPIHISYIEKDYAQQRDIRGWIKH